MAEDHCVSRRRLGGGDEDDMLFMLRVLSLLATYHGAKDRFAKRKNEVAGLHGSDNLRGQG